MNENAPAQNSDLPISVQAEAAAWIARLHGPDRNAEDDRSFQRWLAENVSHAAAFERMTDLWEFAARLKSNALTRHQYACTAEETYRNREIHEATKLSSAFGRRLCGLAAAIVVVAIGIFVYPDDTVSTGIGERRNLTLEDGTRLTLNTATRAKVLYDKTQRRILLESGEAFFEVAQDANRPFLVHTDGSRITALGTAFSVRTDGNRTEVTLVEGKVAVSSSSIPDPTSPFQDGTGSKGERLARDSGKAEGEQVLVPGQRLRLAAHRKMEIDRPAVDRVTAWRQGLIALDRTPLHEAVDEMNRYSRVKLVVAQPTAHDIQVSGVFHAGDSREFAQALARTHGLSIEQSGDTIRLAP